MKIAFFSDMGPPYIGGAQRYVQNLSAELSKYGYEPHWMYTRLPDTKREEIVAGIKSYRVSVPVGRQFYPLFSIPSAYKLAKKMDILQFDTFYAGLSGWLTGKLVKKPHLLTVYEFFQDLWDDMAKNRLESWFNKRAEEYLARSPYPLFATISESTKRRMVELGCKKELIKVIYLGINHALFNTNYEQAFRKRYKLEKKFILGWTGRMNLSQSKNLPGLIEAFKIVKKAVPNTVLAFDGPDFDKLLPVIKQSSLKLGEDIINNGCSKLSDLPKFYRSLDIYTCSSLSEGFGLSVAEAEACGAPAVCFKAGSLPEVVKDNETGLIAKEMTSEALAESIIRLLNNSKKRKKFATSAAKWAKSFDWKKTAKEYDLMYRQLIDGFR